jgi:hypothetical protein
MERGGVPKYNLRVRAIYRFQRMWKRLGQTAVHRFVDLVLYPTCNPLGVPLRRKTA